MVTGSSDLLEDSTFRMVTVCFALAVCTVEGTGNVYLMIPDLQDPGSSRETERQNRNNSQQDQ